MTSTWGGCITRILQASPGTAAALKPLPCRTMHCWTCSCRLRTVRKFPSSLEPAADATSALVSLASLPSKPKEASFSPLRKRPSALAPTIVSWARRPFVCLLPPSEASLSGGSVRGGPTELARPRWGPRCRLGSFIRKSSNRSASPPSFACRSSSRTAALLFRTTATFLDGSLSAPPCRRSSSA